MVWKKETDIGGLFSSISPRTRTEEYKLGRGHSLPQLEAYRAANGYGLFLANFKQKFACVDARIHEGRKKTWEELEGPDLEKRSDLSECPKEIESSVDVDRVFH